MKTPIYLDNHATTRVDPRVVEEMLPFFDRYYGNPATKNNPFGYNALTAVEIARTQVASLLGAYKDEIIFTAGATESLNMAIKGIAEIYHDKGNHIVTSAIEHKAVLEPCRKLAHQGFETTVLPVERYGMADIEAIKDALTDETILIAIMAANNEVGTIQPLKEIGELAKSRNILFLCDAAQAVGKIPLDVETLGIDLLSLSAHKFYGPKGVGALYVRGSNPRVTLAPLLDGGGQEGGLRGGTLNVPGIVGLGKACELCEKELDIENSRLTRLRDKLHHAITGALDGVHLNGHPERRLPNNLNLSFERTDSDALILNMEDIVVSAGSACSTGALTPSPVLKAMGVPDTLAFAAIRFGLGRFNTEEEIDYTIKRVIETVKAVRKLSPLNEN